MRCSNCGHEVLGTGVASCPQCGAPLPLTTAGAAPANTTMAAPSVPTGWAAPAVASSMPPSTTSPPDPGLRRRIVFVIATAVLATIVIYGGGSGVLVLVLRQANAPRPETVIYRSSLKGFSGSWPISAACSYGSDGYHVDGNQLCWAESADSLSDVAVTVTATQTAGLFTAPYGIIIRATKGADGQWYEFAITSSGSWEFSSCNFTTCQLVSGSRTNAAIHTGINAINTMKVRAQGSHFSFFVNQVQVGTAFQLLGPSFGQEGLEGSVGEHVVFTDFIVARVG